MFLPTLGTLRIFIYLYSLSKFMDCDSNLTKLINKNIIKIVSNKLIIDSFCCVIVIAITVLQSANKMWGKQLNNKELSRVCTAEQRQRAKKKTHIWKKAQVEKTQTNIIQCSGFYIEEWNTGFVANYVRPIWLGIGTHS